MIILMIFKRLLGVQDVQWMWNQVNEKTPKEPHCSWDRTTPAWSIHMGQDRLWRDGGQKLGAWSLHALLASVSNLHLRKAFPSPWPLLGLLLFRIHRERADSLSGHMGDWQVTSIYWSVLLHTIKIRATQYCLSWEGLWVAGGFL